MLEIKDLSVTYGPIVAVDSLSLKVGRGEIVALIGANGAGKTSTLQAISAAVESRRGEICFDGNVINNRPTDKLPKMGLVHVPEGRGIFPNLTVEENLIVAASGAGKKLSETEQKVYTAFPRLEERKKQAGWSLSGGEQQMLAIGRAMVAVPKMLLLDEPSLGLAPTIVETIFEEILEIKKNGTGILLVEQNATLALDVADYAHVMRRGEVILSGTAEEVAANDNIRDTYLGVM